MEGEVLPHDPRDRRELIGFDLDTRPCPITSVVVCGHDAGDGAIVELTAAQTLEHLVPTLVLSALAQPVTAWFPHAARLARGRCVQLLHAADPADRLDRAGQLLELARRPR